MYSIGREKAIELAETHWWELCSNREIVETQLFIVELCCPFGVLHEAVEKVLNRPVYTHEFGSAGNLKAEFLGEKEPPTLEEIVELLPKEKRIILKCQDT